MGLIFGLSGALLVRHHYDDFLPAVKLCQLLFLKNNKIGLRHEHSLGLLFDAHDLHHVLFMLLNKIAKFMLEHQRDLCQFHGQLKTLLKLQLLLLIFENILTWSLFV